MPDIENLLNIEDEVTQVLSDLGVNEKLSEMDDFMNQNDLKVNITNENAVVTGLVTYTCTVKDKNNTALANKVVEWYKGTTLLGMDATDSNGISTFSHRVTEADIYDVHAVVRGTHAGDDIRMFVKDNTNLLSHTLWSGGEYNENALTTDIAYRSGATVETSTQYAHNSNKSIKLTYSTGTTHFIRYKSIPIDSNQIGLTASFKTNIYAPNTSGILRLHFFDENEAQISSSSTVISIDNTEQLVAASSVIPADTEDIRIYLWIDNEGSLFIDNQELTIQ